MERPAAADPSTPMLGESWEADMLGNGFEQLILPLDPDDEGEVVATLVRYVPPPREPARERRWRWPWEAAPEPEGPPPAASGADVLYVHGWSDYFFNSEIARFWADAGARFFALDLRKYGRSLREGQTPAYVTDLGAYDADLEAALDAMDSGGRPLILMGHSTGGLILSLWAARNPGRADALVLNSPWLEFQLRGIGRQAISPVIEFGARVNPMRPLPNIDRGFYARSIAREFDGEWEYDHRLRPDRGFPIHPAWLTAILAGHAAIDAGIDVGVPVLTLLSARSTFQSRWDDAMLTTDTVLVVDDIARHAIDLGSEVTVVRIDGALHDVLLSREPARAAAYAAITRWLRGYAPQ
ncbi:MULTISPECIES: alpha/beta hydrolase [unclassified Agromyces]|uniref:alpha/beta hydrolase n=1 Tax=unclassified Agromyces TaxID=2639701 RepID=UPI0030151440